MELSDKEVREKLLQIYTSCRQSPDAPFDEDRFLDHLIEPPAHHGQIKDSFASNRRFVRFIDDVQAEFAVFFSLNDWDTNFTLSQFITRIQALRTNSTGSLRSLNNARSSYDINAVLVLNLIMLVSTWFSRHFPWLFAFFVTAWLALNGWIFWFYSREKKYLDDLKVKILGLRKKTDRNS